MAERGGGGVTTLEQGIHFDVPEDVYHSDPAPDPSLSSSLAKILLEKSPMHASKAHPRLNPDWEPSKSTTAMLLGSAFDAMVLGGESRIGLVQANDYKTKAAQAERDRILLEGRVPLTAPQYEELTKALAIFEARLANIEDELPPLRDGKAQATLIWFDDEFGIWCRARPDWLRDDHRAIDDLKTTKSARPDSEVGGFGRIAYSLSYDIQAAFYRRGLMKLDPDCDPRFRFVAYERKSPNGISLVELGPAGRILGETRVADAMRLFADCLKNNRWPEYPRFACRVDPPPWAMAQVETGDAPKDMEALEW